MNRFPILLISDLDGTLIGEQYKIPERNLQAIRRFQGEGGSFAIATGRSIESGGKYLRSIYPNGPCVCLNGTLVYDYKQERILMEHPLIQQSAAQYLKRIYDRFPALGIEYFCRRDLHILRSNAYIKEHIRHESANSLEISDLDGTQPWFKALFADTPARKDEVYEFTKTFDHPDVRFISSSGNYLEMLPAHANKGTALRKAAAAAGFSVCDVYAIGDYYNDKEMLQAAGVSAAPENAPEDMKAMVDVVVGHCRDGAVADFIEWIEAQQGRAGGDKDDL